MIIKVTSDFEVKHFIGYVENQLRTQTGVSMSIVDATNDELIVNFYDAKFKVSKEVMHLITTKCPNLVIKNEIIN